MAIPSSETLKTIAQGQQFQRDIQKILANLNTVATLSSQKSLEHLTDSLKYLPGSGRSGNVSLGTTQLLIEIARNEVTYGSVGVASALIDHEDPEVANLAEGHLRLWNALMCLMQALRHEPAQDPSRFQTSAEQHAMLGRNAALNTYSQMQNHLMAQCQQIAALNMRALNMNSQPLPPLPPPNSQEKSPTYQETYIREQSLLRRFFNRRK